MAVKAKEFKKKKLYYRRASWDGQNSKTLESYLAKAHEELDTVGKRTFSNSINSELRGADFKDDQGLFLHIASYVPGGATSTIDTDTSATTSNIDIQRAPSGKDYLSGDVFVYIKGNHVVICPSGVREAGVNRYMRHMLLKIKEKGIAQSFELDTIARTSKLQMIKEEGVNEIQLNSSLYDASLAHLDKNNPKITGIASVIANQLSSIFAKDSELKEIEEKENVNIKVSLKVDGAEAMKHYKDTEFGAAGKKRLEKSAEEILQAYDEDHEDGFVIITGLGNKITAESIRVSQSYKIKTLGNTLNKVSAWEQLKAYYSLLKAEGILSK